MTEFAEARQLLGAGANGIFEPEVDHWRNQMPLL
jgi:hypothetical protein